MNPLRVAVVHYHRRPGGVTRVMERQAEALRASAGLHVALFTGGPAAAPTPDRAWQVLPELDYDPGPPDAHRVDALARRLRSAAREALGGAPDVWHVHNHALGKNPALTAVVARFAHEQEPLLLHLHDFVEDGRPDGYRRLAALPGSGGGPAWWYPQAPHVHYAVLNGRDAALLHAAGFAPDRVHLLPNPVGRDDTPAADAGAATPADPPLILYPTRAIRRKNLGEFLLMALAWRPAKARFAVSLSPVSEIDRPYYEAAQAFAGRHRLPVEFDAGRHTPGGFPALMARARTVITTSLAEGFGLAFLEPWLYGRPLAGRNLPAVTADFVKEGLRFSGLYGDWRIPLAAFDHDAWRTRTADRLRRTWSAYGRTATDADVERARAAASDGHGADFGHLDECAQFECLEHLAAHGAVVPDLPAALSHTPADAELAANRACVETRYALSVFRTRLEDAYARVAAAPAGGMPHPPAGSVLDGFLVPERFLPLRALP